MSMNTVTDNGGEDQYPEQGPLDQLPESAAQDDKVMSELTPDAPPQDTTPQVMAADDRVMNELSSVSARPSMLEEVQAVTNEPTDSPKQSKGRFSVPPSQRTPGNREERRQEAAEFNNPAEAPTLQQYFDEGGELPNSASDDDSEKLVSLLESGFKLSATLAYTVIDLTRRLNELTEAVERARL
jgi:hypothetical protein